MWPKPHERAELSPIWGQIWLRMPKNPCQNLLFDYITGFGLFLISFVLILNVPILSVRIYFVLIYMWHLLSNTSRFLVEKSKFSEIKLSNTKLLTPVNLPMQRTRSPTSTNFFILQINIANDEEPNRHLASPVCSAC